MAEFCPFPFWLLWTIVLLLPIGNSLAADRFPATGADFAVVSNAFGSVTSGVVPLTTFSGLLYDAAADMVADEFRPGSGNGRNGVWTYGGYNPSLKIFTSFTTAQHVESWPLGLANPPPIGTFQGYGSLAGDQTPVLAVNTDSEMLLHGVKSLSSDIGWI